MSIVPRFDVLTVHPDMVDGPLSCSIIGRARNAGRVGVHVHDIREYGIGRHKTVDDTPYGGGPGMVMRVDVVANCINAVPKRNRCRVLLTSPTGRRFDQQFAQQLMSFEQVIIVCGHYEGIDARIEDLVDESVSLGDFVMTGGEIAAVAVVDAVARLHPGVLGNDASANDESFADGLLEYPQFTRPKIWNDEEVPAVLLSGHHRNIEKWRTDQKIARTRSLRPDLFAAWQGRNSAEVVDIRDEDVDVLPDVE